MTKLERLTKSLGWIQFGLGMVATSLNIIYLSKVIRQMNKNKSPKNEILKIVK